MHQQIAVFRLQTVQTDDDLLDLIRTVFHKIHTGKEGIHQHAMGTLRHVLRKLTAHDKAIHLRGQLIQFLLRKGCGAQTQFIPRVRNDGLDGLHVSAGHLLCLFDQRQQKPLHPGGVFPLSLQILQLLHVSLLKRQIKKSS